jgi:hypothetical protein
MYFIDLGKGSGNTRKHSRLLTEPNSEIGLLLNIDKFNRNAKNIIHTTKNRAIYDSKQLVFPNKTSKR